MTKTVRCDECGKELTEDTLPSALSALGEHITEEHD